MSLEDEDSGLALEKIVELFQSLSTEEQETACAILNARVWKRQVRTFKEIDWSESAVQAWEKVTDSLSSGNAFDDLIEASSKTWGNLSGLFSAIQSAVDGRGEGGTDEPTTEPSVEHINRVYEDLQTCLIGARQAVAMSIATEKQLENQVQRNEEQAETWKSRADMARQQGNDALAAQAEQRRAQYAEGAAIVDEQLLSMKSETSEARKQLNELEALVQKAYTRKQIFVARNQTLKARVKVKQMINLVNVAEALSTIEKEEQLLKESEHEDDLASDLEKWSQLGSEELLARAMSALDDAVSVIKKMQKRLQSLEEQQTGAKPRGESDEAEDHSDNMS